MSYPTEQQREAFLDRITEGDQGAIHLRQFIERAIDKLEQMDARRELGRVVDVAITTERNCLSNAIKNRGVDSGKQA